MSHCSEFGWVFGDPLSAAYKSHPGTPLDAKDWATRLPVRSGDRVALLYNDDEVLLTARLLGKTFKSFLASLDKGLRAKLPVTDENTTQVYRAISRWGSKNNRLRLVKKYEQGLLTGLDLAGDYVHFAGCLRREAKGIWTYALEN